MLTSNSKYFLKPLLFYFDANLKLDFKLRANVYSYVYDRSMKSFYLYMDLGLKHFLSSSLSLFFDLFLNDDKKFNEYSYNFLYLFEKSFGSLIYSFEDVKFDFDYFKICNHSMAKYSEECLYLFFFDSYFFRKLRVSCFEMDFFVSYFHFNFSNYNNVLNLADASFSLNSGFAKDYWHSRNTFSLKVLFKNFLKFFQKILNNKSWDKGFKKIDIGKENLDHFKIDFKIWYIDNISNFVEFFCYLNEFQALHNHFLRPYESFLIKMVVDYYRYVKSLEKGFKFLDLKKYKQYKLCLFLYETIISYNDAYLLNYNFFNLIFHGFDYLDTKFLFGLYQKTESLPAYLARKYEYSWSKRSSVPSIVSMYFGFHGFFKSEDVANNEWYHMSTYHHRQFTFRISDFLLDTQFRLFFVFRKHYTNFFMLKSGKMSTLELITNLANEFKLSLSHLWFLRRYNPKGNTSVFRYKRAELAKFYLDNFSKYERLKFLKDKPLLSRFLKNEDILNFLNNKAEFDLFKKNINFFNNNVKKYDSVKKKAF